MEPAASGSEGAASFTCGSLISPSGSGSHGAASHLSSGSLHSSSYVGVYACKGAAGFRAVISFGGGVHAVGGRCAARRARLRALRAALGRRH